MAGPSLLLLLESAGASTPTTSAVSVRVVKRGGSTFIDTTDPTKVDCILGDIEHRANQPMSCTLTVPATSALLTELLDSDLAVDTTALIEVTISGSLLPRFVLTGARLVDVSPGNLNAVEFQLQDRRYELQRRYVGRTGFPANETPTFYDGSGLPAGWTINPGAPDTVTVTPLGTPGVFGTRAMVVNATGAGPGNSVSAGVNLTTETYDRSIGFGTWAYLPAGGWTVNAENRLIQIVAYETATNVVKDSVFATAYTSDAWQILIGSVRVPAGATYSIELRLFAPNGSVYFEAPGLELTESLAWASADVADAINDLVAHAHDSTWGHSDTGLRSDATSVPATGITVSRSIESTAKQQVSSAVEEFCNMGALWQRVFPQSDGTDTFYADADGINPGVSASSTNANIGGWEWAGDNHAGMLGVFAPDNIDPAGSRLVMGIGASGVLDTFGTAWDLGREQYMPGPYGSYDPRVVSNLLVPFFKAKEAALTVPITFGFDTGVVSAFASGALRPGCSLPANVGSYPVGVNDTFRVTRVQLNTQSWQVSVDVNREIP